MWMVASRLGLANAIAKSRAEYWQGMVQDLHLALGEARQIAGELLAGSGDKHLAVSESGLAQDLVEIEAASREISELGLKAHIDGFVGDMLRMGSSEGGESRGEVEVLYTKLCNIRVVIVGLVLSLYVSGCGG